MKTAALVLALTCLLLQAGIIHVFAEADRELLSLPF